jgi:hypothetical protein
MEMNMNAVSPSIVPPQIDLIQPAIAEIQRHEIRFFCQMGWSTLSVDTDAIPRRELPRGIIMPCRSFQQLAPRFEIKEGDRIAGTEQTDREGKHVLMKYWKFAQAEADRLNEIEEYATPHKTGLREIKSLRGREEVYTSYQLNALMYAGLAELPPSNAAMIEHLENRLQMLREDPPRGISHEDLPVVLQAIAEVLEAARANAEMQLRRIEHSHSCMKLSPADKSGAYKPAYDSVDEELLVRTGQKRIHSADQATAEALELLAEKSTEGAGGDLKDLIAVLKEQNENQQLLIQALLAERAELKTKKGGKE